MLNISQLSYWELKVYFKNIDHLIIGAGIVGYSTALNLRKKHPKAKILVIERGYLPSGASSKNAGFACFGSATELYDDLQHMEESLVWETVSMRLKGLEELDRLIGKQNFDYQENGSWDLITPNQLELFEQVSSQLGHFNKMLKDISGQSEVYSIDNNASDKFGFGGIHSAFRNRIEGQIDTSQLNTAFHQKVIENNIHVLFNITAQSIDTGSVETNAGTIKASNIYVCTNAFAKEFFPEKDINPARAQVLITEPIPLLKVKGTFHYDKGYYYFRNIDNRILFGGGRNLDFEGETTQEMTTTPKIIGELEKLLSTVILPNTSFKVEHQWAGIMGVGNEKKPIIEEVKPQVYCGVRLGGMGVAIGSLVGKELSNYSE